MSTTFTDLLIHIFSHSPGQPAYRVHAMLEDGSVFTQAELRLNRAALAGSESVVN